MSAWIFALLWERASIYCCNRSENCRQLLSVSYVGLLVTILVCKYIKWLIGNRSKSGLNRNPELANRHLEMRFLMHWYPWLACVSLSLIGPSYIMTFSHPGSHLSPSLALIFDDAWLLVFLLISPDWMIAECEKVVKKVIHTWLLWETKEVQQLIIIWSEAYKVAEQLL